VQIQSLSVVVPGRCVNNCAFCVSQTHESPYDDVVSPIFHQGRGEPTPEYVGWVEREYRDRLAFARDNGTNVAILTGATEPLARAKFVDWFAKINQSLDRPFRWVEVQSTGVFLVTKPFHRWDCLYRASVKTIALSVSDPFDDENNMRIIGVPTELQFKLEDVCGQALLRHLNVRICVNMTDALRNVTPQQLFDRVRELGAQQIMLRRLYTSEGHTEKDEWVRQHALGTEEIEVYRRYIAENGKPLERLPFGAMRYSLGGLSTVLDEDCMAQEVKESIRYLILREDCHLYSRWEDEASRLF
jgi:hypothetical protein